MKRLRLCLIIIICVSLFGSLGVRASAATGAQVVAEATGWIGTPYLYGGNSKSGVDCSGLVMHVYKALGYSLPRVSYDQAKAGRKIVSDALLKGDLSSLQPGDIICFGSSEEASSISHVGIYDGNGHVIHASTTDRMVKLDDLKRWITSGGYYPAFQYAVRILEDEAPVVTGYHGPALKPGDIGENVSALQNCLLALGYPVTNTGIFDEATESVVKSIQFKFALPMDGILNQETIQKLNELAETKQPKTIVMRIGHSIMQVGSVKKEIDPGYETTPIVLNGSTLAPVRAVAEELGASVKWDGAAKKVTIEKGSTVITLWIGKQTAQINQTSVTLDASPVIIGSRTYMPIRFIAETLGAKVSWNGASSAIIITQ